MRRPTVLVMMTSTMTSEPRVRRQARTLTAMGYRVVALGIRREGHEATRQRVGQIDVRRVDLPDLVAVRAVRRRRVPSPATSHTPSHTTSSIDRPSMGATTWDWKGDVRNIVHWLSCLPIFTWYAWRSNADVLHPHDLPPALPAVIVGAVRRRPIVYESHECWSEKFPTRPLSRAAAHWIERLVARRSVLTIAVNDSIAQRMGRELRVPTPLTVLNVPDADPIAEVEPAIGPLRVLYHGAVEAGRGVEHAVAAIAAMSEPAELVIRGSGGLLPSIGDLVESSGVADRVRIEPPVAFDEIVAAAARSHVAIIPLEPRLGYDYALPNKLFESMAAGLAVVATDLVEIRRVLASSGAGVVVAYEDSGEFAVRLATQLDSLARDRGRLNEMRERALAGARDRYVWNVHEQVLVDAYPKPSGVPR